MMVRCLIDRRVADAQAMVLVAAIEHLSTRADDDETMS